MTTDIVKLMRRIPRKYRGTVRSIMNVVDAQAASRAHEIGRQAAMKDLAQNGQLIDSAMLMTFQRLGDANAQMTTCFAELLKKRLQR